MYARALVLCLLAVSVIVVAQNTAANNFQDCTYEDDSGDYDLTNMIVNLTSASTLNNLYQGTDTDGYKYYVNVCNVVTSDTGCPGTDNTPTCQVSSSGSQATSCGVVTTQEFRSANSTTSPDGGVVIWYTGGKTCTNGVHNNRTSILTISCVEGAASAITAVVEDYCWYEIAMNSGDACSTGGGGAAVDPGWLIMFLVCLIYFVYVIVGVIIKYVKFEGRGLDMVPNIDFWKDIPFLIRDGCVFTVQKVSMGKLCAGYNTI
mmetsp:Transcript_15810/g.61783  ORF Transcript_15810/g.61783 Transcript_15810/m.61783 type:complete len:261 (+) Transcript_15810:42-824(+)